MIEITASGAGDLYYAIDSDNYSMTMYQGGSGIMHWMLKNVDVVNLDNQNFLSTNPSYKSSKIPFSPLGQYSSTYHYYNTHQLMGANFDTNDPCEVSWLVDGESEEEIYGAFDYVRITSSGIIKKVPGSTYGASFAGSGITNITFYENIIVLDNTWLNIIEDNTYSACKIRFCSLSANIAYTDQQSSEYNFSWYGSGTINTGDIYGIYKSSTLLLNRPHNNPNIITILQNYLDHQSTGPASGQFSSISAYFEYPEVLPLFPSGVGMLSSAGNNVRSQIVVYSPNDYNSSYPYTQAGDYRSVTLLLGGASGSYDPIKYAFDFGFPDPLDGSSNAGEVITGTLNTSTDGDNDSDGFNESLYAYAVQSTNGKSLEVKFNHQRGFVSHSGIFITPRILVTGWTAGANPVVYKRIGDGEWSIVDESEYRWTKYSNTSKLFQYLNNIDFDEPELSFRMLSGGDASGEMPIYISAVRGYINSNIDLYTWGVDSLNNEINVYICGILGSNSGIFPLYVVCCELYNNNTDIFVCAPPMCEAPIFIHGYDSYFDEIDLYIRGVLTINNSLNVFVSVLDQETLGGNTTLFILGPGPSGTLDLYTVSSDGGITPFDNEITIYCKPENSNEIPIFVCVEGGQQSGVLDLYVQSIPSVAIPIFVQAEDNKVYLATDIYIKGTLGGSSNGDVTSLDIDLYVYGKGTYDWDGDYPSSGYYVENNSMNIFVGNDQTIASLDLYVLSDMVSVSGIANLYTFGVTDTTNNNIDIFIHPKDETTRFFPFFITGWWPQ